MPVTINGVDLATLGFDLRRRDGDLTPALDAPPTVAASDGFGDRVSGAPARAAVRTLTLTGRLVAASAFALEAARDALIRACAGNATGPASNAVTIVLRADGGAATRQWTGYLAGNSEVKRRDPTGQNRIADATLTFTIPDPTAVDATATAVSLSTTLARTALGDLRSRPLILLDGGSWTAITVTYKDGANATVSSVTITKPSGTAGTGQSIEIDCAAESVVQINGGTRTPRNDWLTAGDFVTLDPAHVVSGTNPGLVLSSGTGSASYRKRWR